jgi:hypothetical protein
MSTANITLHYYDAARPAFAARAACLVARRHAGCKPGAFGRVMRWFPTCTFTTRARAGGLWTAPPGLERRRLRRRSRPRPRPNVAFASAADAGHEGP